MAGARALTFLNALWILRIESAYLSFQRKVKISPIIPTAMRWIAAKKKKRHRTSYSWCYLFGAFFSSFHQPMEKRREKKKPQPNETDIFYNAIFYAFHSVLGVELFSLSVCRSFTARLIYKWNICNIISQSIQRQSKNKTKTNRERERDRTHYTTPKPGSIRTQIISEYLFNCFIFGGTETIL